MYLKPGPVYYDRGGEQCCPRAPFLILVQSKEHNGSLKGHMRAIVRKVALRQCGQWMMGIARIKGKSYTISGAYGSDGLPLTVSQEAYELGVPVPDDLYEAWNTGGGWNSAGSEGPDMRKWARKVFNL